MADQYLNKSDQSVLNVVTQEVLQCMYGGDPKEIQAAAQQAQMSLQQALTAGDTDNDFTYRALEDVIRRLAGRREKKSWCWRGRVSSYRTRGCRRPG